MHFLSVIYELLIIILLSAKVISQEYTVKLKNGTIVGRTMKSKNEREFVAFRGVPYALPPIGPWRFEPPQPSPAWTKIHYGKYEGKKCLHKNVHHHKDHLEGDEDCLYLNIYTPKVEYDAKESKIKYPVMVFFHGGSWSTGSSYSKHYGPNFMLDHDVILVTINYRLGPFGFLSTGDSVVPGNMGLKDQVHGLRWVQENIEVFGGDPDSVTIFGSGVGGASVHYLMMSPLAKGLFHRAISQSGSAKNPWAFNTAAMAKEVTNRLAADLRCPTDNSMKMLKCLRNVQASKLATIYLDWPVFDLDPMMPFRPVAEPEGPGTFLTVGPHEFNKLEDVSKVPWMVGLNAHEGAFRVASIYRQKKPELLKQLDENFEQYAPLSLAFDNSCPAYMHSPLSRRIRKFYLAKKSINRETRAAVLNMYSDALFTVGVHQAIKEYSSMSSPTYYYHLTHQSQLSHTKFYGDRDQSKYGVAHGDELQYLFPLYVNLFPFEEFTDEDLKMVDTMTTMWFNFARTGNPIPEETDLFNTKWSPVESESLEHLLISGPGKLKMSKDLFKDRINFWNKLPCPAGIAPSYGHIVQDEL